MTVRGAVYHGFRAPTLNEFYRNFSAGSTLTRANEALGPERMTGGDAGVLVGNGRASARITGFWNRLDDAITAITLSSTPTQIIDSAPTPIACSRTASSWRETGACHERRLR